MQKYQKISAQKERWLGQTAANYQLSNFDAGSFLLRNLRCLHQNLHYGFKHILLQLPSADFSPSPRRLTSHIICATPIIGLQQKLPVNLLSGFPDPRRLTSHMSSAKPIPLSLMELIPHGITSNRVITTTLFEKNIESACPVVMSWLYSTSEMCGSSKCNV